METGRDVVEMFFDALAAPKSNLTNEYLSGGMSHPPGIIETPTTKE